MVHRYANYYIAALLAMVTAFIIGLSSIYDTLGAGLLVIIPIVSFMLSQQGKLMTFRFYRRYTEGRVRLTKIEYLLGLHGPIKWSGSVEHEYAPWPDDQGFVLGRYVNEAHYESASCEFIQRRSWVPRCWQLSPSDEDKPFRIIDLISGTACWLRELLQTSRPTNDAQSPSDALTTQSQGGYGAGYIIHTTLTVFSGLSVIAIVGLPLGLLIVHTSVMIKLLNFVYSALGLFTIWVYMRWYSSTLSKMERETPLSSDKNNASLSE